MSEPPPPPSASDEPVEPPSPVRDEDLEPIARDKRFLVRLVLASFVGVGAAAFVGWKIRKAAAGCGAGMIRPGESVIPNDDAGR